MDTQVTILEYINEYGQYIFYAVYRTLTPRQAVERYLEESNLTDDSVKISEEDGEAFVEDVCRAYRVELED